MLAGHSTRGRVHNTNRGNVYRHDSNEHGIVWGVANQDTAYFDDSTDTNVTAVVGQKAKLPCKVIKLGGKDVSKIKIIFIYYKRIPEKHFDI